MVEAAAAQAFVAAHREGARSLGAELADLVDRPEAFVSALRAGLAELADPAYATLVEVVSPKVPAGLAVRGPLVRIIAAPVRRALGEGSSAIALWLAQRLVAADERDVRLFALPCLLRSLVDDPEQSWQLMRRMAARATDWIEVDSLADVWARGILAEGFRWAELEQLVYSQRVFERRLVAATLATMPHRVPSPARKRLREGPSRRALDLLRLLMGDREPPVQKAMSWAVREWTRVDPDAVAQMLFEESDLAVAGADGARAWVIRDSLSHQPAELGAALRIRLEGLRRDRWAPSTSIAAGRSARFAAALAGAADAADRQGDRYAGGRP
jgi:3-methyladenine DNA glycosylase AlkD